MAFKLRLDSRVVLRTSLPDCASLMIGRHKLYPRPGRWTFGIAEGALTLPFPSAPPYDPSAATSLCSPFHTRVPRPSPQPRTNTQQVLSPPVTSWHAPGGPRARFLSRAYHVHLGPLQRADTFWALKPPGKGHLTRAEP